MLDGVPVGAVRAQLEIDVPDAYLQSPLLEVLVIAVGTPWNCFAELVVCSWAGELPRLHCSPLNLGMLPPVLGLLECATP